MMDSVKTSKSNIADIGTIRDDLVLVVDGADYRRIPTPSILKEDLVFTAMRRLISSYYLYKVWSISRYKNVFNALFYFCECFKESKNLVSLNGRFLLSRSTGRIFVDYLVAINRSESTIYGLTEAVKILLQHCISVECTGFLGTSAEEWRRTKQILDDWPKVLRPETLDHRPGLAEKFEIDCDEQQMLMSVKLFCPWFLRECHRIRKDFRERCPEKFQWLLKQASDPVRRRTLERPAVTAGISGTELENQAYTMLVNAMRSIDSPLFFETILFKGVLLGMQSDESNDDNGIMNGLGLAFPEPVIDYGSWDKDSIVSRLESFQCAAGVTRRRQIRSGERRFFSMHSLFSPMFLLIPSAEEKMVISWLLAAERVQRSNLDRIRMQDVRKLNSVISVSSYKGRNATTGSAHFRRGDPAYDALLGYKESMVFGYENGLVDQGETVDEAAFIPGLKDAFFVVNEQKTTCCLLLPLVVRSSITQKAYLDYCEEIGTAACPDHFIRCMSSAYGFNSEFFKRRNADVCQGRRMAKLGSSYVDKIYKDLARKCANVGSRSLGPQVVAQTCVLGNDSARGMKSLKQLILDDEMTKQYDDKQELDDVIHAQRMRHSLSSEGVYSDFSKCKQKIEVDEKFGALVGSEMCSIARKAAELMIDKSCVVSLEQVDSLLKLSGGNKNDMLNEEQLLECAELQDFVVDKVGLFEKDGLTYVVKTPLVAALIKGKIDHIETDFKRIMNDNPLRVKRLLSLLVFYKALLNEIGLDVVRKGCEKYGRYEIAFSDLNI